MTDINNLNDLEDIFKNVGNALEEAFNDFEYVEIKNAYDVC